MDPWPLVAVILAIGLIVTLAALDRATRGMRRVRGLVGVGREGDPVYGVERLIERVARLETGLAAARSDRNVLLDGLDVGIVDLDPSLQVTYANPAVHAFVGRVPGTLLGLDVLEAFLDPEVEAIARSAVDQGSAVGEVRFRGTDGPTLIVHARRSSSGGAWLVLADVSELRRLQQIRAEFIDNLSHELRTPLTSVSLLAETLSREADTLGDAVPPRMRDRISKIEVETGHLVQMVTEIMDLSRIESGGALSLVDDVDLGRLAESSVERLRLFAERQGVELRVDVTPGLPPVRGDEARLGQVFVNLLHNAVKFSPGGGEVLVSVRRSDGELIASVEDHGIGVPRGAQQRIFERFYKADRARVRGEAPGGTGLGLAISRHVVEQHGGRIWVESAEGVGSTFSFALPLEPKET